MRIASRYFATVRRAISTPVALQQLDETLVDSVLSDGSRSDQAAMRNRNRFGRMRVPAARAAIAR